MQLRNNLFEVTTEPEWTKEFEAYTERYPYEDDFYQLHMDGIIDRAKWDRDGTGIMLFCDASWKGQYIGHNYIHLQILRLKEAIYRDLPYYFRIEDGWIKAVEEGLFHRPATKECRVHYAALVNVAKIDDKVTYGNCATENGVVCDGAFLYRQIQAIAPKVVLSANLADWFFEVMRRGEEDKFRLKELPEKRVTQEFMARRVKTLYQSEKGGAKLTVYDYDGLLVFDTASPMARGRYATKPETILNAIREIQKSAR